jgi:transcriptional/translational regulatory protein YebC/TACO1
MIDLGVEEVEAEEENVVLYGTFESYGAIQHYLEDKGYEIVNSEFERIPVDTKELTEEQEAEVQKIFEKFDEDDDVQNYFHNMK